MLRDPVTIEGLGAAGVAAVWGWLLVPRRGRLRSVVMAAGATVALWYACRLVAGPVVSAPFAVGVSLSLATHVWWRNHLVLHSIQKGA